MDIERVLKPGGELSASMPGYEYRPQQVQVALAIDEAIRSRRHCLVEAGTGVGKSMAYLLPAINHTLDGGRIVISTYTLYLQDQLINKDIPFLGKILPKVRFKAVLMKGRANYLCLKNYETELSQLTLIDSYNLSRFQKWATQTETGDISELDFSFPDWSEVCSDQDTCSHQKCPWFTKCFYYKMRRAANDAAIIVANHSLFFTDLSIRANDPQASILPDYRAVIFDEAHHLEDVASRVFGVDYTNYRINSLLNRVLRTKGITITPERIKAIEDLNELLFSYFKDFPKQEFFFAELYECYGQDKIITIVSDLCNLLDGLSRELREQNTERNPELQDRLTGLCKTCSRLKEELILLFCDSSGETFSWAEKLVNSKFVHCVLHRTPVSVANILRTNLWRNVDTAVLTSATLSNSGTFTYLKSRLGITNCREVIEDSPFDFWAQCLLYIPDNLDFPSERPAYVEKVSHEIESLVRASRGRAFLLFTSYRMMNAVYDYLSNKLPFRLLKQGDMSNEALIKEFLKGHGACLFGVQSFWEGVDIRGHALSCVIIDKLPFSVPDNPVNRARVDAITADGGDWFVEYAIPQAQIRLRQGFGRLIRTKEDYGVVAILDSRLLKKSYGRQFISFLPKCRITSSIEDVRSFFKEKEK